jgi:hypothetical protein
MVQASWLKSALVLLLAVAAGVLWRRWRWKLLMRFILDVAREAV